jgi:hypothetical protein
MTEPLEVDPPRLKAAGNALRSLAFPAAPPPIVAPGTDSVSAAINATLPVIESPVIDGLRDAPAALTKTGSNIVAAATMYAETDRTLGEHVGKVQFVSSAAGPAANQLMGAAADKPSDDESPAIPEPAAPVANPVFDQIPTQLGQVAAAAAAMAPLTQNMQTVMSTVQGATGGMGSAGSPPAQLADDTGKADGEEEQPADSLADGAASGEPATGTAPVEAAPGAPQPTSAGRL